MLDILLEDGANLNTTETNQKCIVMKLSQLSLCVLHACIVNSTPHLSPKGMMCWLQGKLDLMDKHVKHLHVPRNLSETRVGDSLEFVSCAYCTIWGRPHRIRFFIEYNTWAISCWENVSTIFIFLDASLSHFVALIKLVDKFCVLNITWINLERYL